jgi:hypothetical protein
MKNELKPFDGMDSNGHFLFSVLVLFVQFSPLIPVKNGCFRAYEPTRTTISHGRIKSIMYFCKE